MSRNNPDFDIDRAFGEEAEQLTMKLRSDILSGSIEIKRDARYVNTGNLYIEYTCRTVNGWQSSGLSTTKADTYMIFYGNPESALVVRTQVLKEFFNENRDKLAIGEEKDGSHPTKGWLLNVKYFNEWLRKTK